MILTRHRLKMIHSHLILGRTRRQAIRKVRSEEMTAYRSIANVALQDLSGAILAHRLRFRDIREYLGVAILPALRRRRSADSITGKFIEESAAPPKEEQENPLKGAREAAAYFISSPRLRELQGQIVRTAFADWYHLKITSRQMAVLGCYSDTAWIARGLMKSAGLPQDLRRLGTDERRRLSIVLEPYIRGLDLRRHHLEGLTHPGRSILASLSQQRRVGRLERRGFSPEDLKVLYPDMLDQETLRFRRESLMSLRDDALRLIDTRSTGLQFENYLHLQTLTMGAPSRGPKRLGRYMAAVELRHAA
jgi:hypothetical protein